MTKLTMDGKIIEVTDGTTLLEAAKSLGIRIPTLCHNDKLSHYGGCRICLVEVGTEAAPDRTRLMPSCCTKAESGQVVRTASERALSSRRFVLQLMLSRSPGSEKLVALAKELGVLGEGAKADIVGAYLLERAPKTEETNCIRCSQCVRACAEIVERHAISFEARGMKRRVVSPFRKVAETCIGCGSCAYVCPTKTITVEEAAEG